MVVEPLDIEHLVKKIKQYDFIRGFSSVRFKQLYIRYILEKRRFTKLRT